MKDRQRSAAHFEHLTYGAKRPGVRQPLALCSRHRESNSALFDIVPQPAKVFHITTGELND
jgi:hypothetical protein